VDGDFWIFGGFLFCFVLFYFAKRSRVSSGSKKGSTFHVSQASGSAALADTSFSH
jgi:hypothetical protein